MPEGSVNDCVVVVSSNAFTVTGGAISAPRRDEPVVKCPATGKIPANAQNGFRIRTGGIVQVKPVTFCVRLIRSANPFITRVGDRRPIQRSVATLYLKRYIPVCHAKAV